MPSRLEGWGRGGHSLFLCGGGETANLRTGSMTPYPLRALRHTPPPPPSMPGLDTHLASHHAAKVYARRTP